MTAVELLQGDCLAILPTLAENSLDACVTDPPYHLTSIVKRFGGAGAAPAKFGTDGAFARASAGFMGKTWDGGDIAFRPEVWAEVYRVLKPGAFLLAFGGTRTYHRMTCAIEDAGFEIRDCLGWLYGQGFPKSHDVSKGIDKMLGAEGAFGEPKSAAHAGWITRGRMRGDDNEEGWQRPWMADPEKVGNAARKYLPGSPEAAAWEGWGTALKPAWEPIVMARKPLVGTVAANVLAFGTGAINIDGCRVADGSETGGAKPEYRPNFKNEVFGRGCGGGWENTNGRWPANIIHDGSDDVLTRLGDASRFFYCPKAGKADRAGSKHPTVKPLALMRYLCRLVTPPGGTIIDPFAGSGTTGQAAREEGFNAVLIEREEEYAADIRRRLGLAAPESAAMLGGVFG